MFGTARPLGAATRYRQIDVDSRVEGATPHQLVAILFEELVKAFDGLLHAIDQGDAHRERDRRVRAITILHGLETALDFDRGGEIALNLARIYREARRLLDPSVPGRRAAVQQARGMIAEIAGAWADIVLPAAQ